MSGTAHFDDELRQSKLPLKRPNRRRQCGLPGQRQQTGIIVITITKRPDRRQQHWLAVTKAQEGLTQGPCRPPCRHQNSCP
jgi:hypothetical protein